MEEDEDGRRGAVDGVRAELGEDAAVNEGEEGDREVRRRRGGAAVEDRGAVGRRCTSRRWGSGRRFPDPDRGQREE